MIIIFVSLSVANILLNYLVFGGRAMDWSGVLGKLKSAVVGGLHVEGTTPDLLYRVDEDWRRRRRLTEEEEEEEEVGTHAASAAPRRHHRRRRRRRLDPGSWKCPDNMPGRQTCIDKLMDKRFKCKKCPGRVWWHPGWRGHQLRGTMLGRFWLSLFKVSFIFSL